MRDVFEDDRDTLADLAAYARSLWDDPSVLEERDAWINEGRDEEIVGWAYAHGLLS